MINRLTDGLDMVAMVADRSAISCPGLKLILCGSRQQSSNEA